MDKEEAMKILKDFHDKSALFSVRTALHTIIPELRESEDERIRENIIAALKGEGYYDCDLTNECIAWVEKQGNQREQLINKACDVLVDYIESYMFSRKQGWNKESKKKTLENIRKELEE